MPNYNIFATNTLPSAEIASTTTIYNQFAIAQTNTVLWTPDTGKSIYLTSIQISTLITQNVSLQRAGNAAFLVIGFNATIAIMPYSTSFLSPVKFNTNESISLTSTGLGTLDITLFGYEV